MDSLNLAADNCRKMPMIRSEVARLLECSKTTVGNLVARGLLHPKRRDGIFDFDHVEVKDLRREGDYFLKAESRIRMPNGRFESAANLADEAESLLTEAELSERWRLKRLNFADNIIDTFAEQDHFGRKRILRWFAREGFDVSLLEDIDEMQFVSNHFGGES